MKCDESETEVFLVQTADPHRPSAAAAVMFSLYTCALLGLCTVYVEFHAYGENLRIITSLTFHIVQCVP